MVVPRLYSMRELFSILDCFTKWSRYCAELNRPLNADEQTRCFNEDFFD